MNTIPSNIQENYLVHEKITALIEGDYQSLINAAKIEAENRKNAAYEQGNAEMEQELPAPEPEPEWIQNPPEAEVPEVGDGSGQVTASVGHVPNSLMDLFNHAGGIA